MEHDTDRNRWQRAAVGGGIAGLIAGIVMAMWTMFASGTYLHMRVFTPVYAIAATFLGRDAMQTSLEGGAWHWTTGPALLGLGIHMVNSIVLGVIFGLLAAWLGLRGWSALVGGVVYGLIALLAINFIVVPVTGSVDMGRLFGWGTWTVSHLVFGAVLGLWPVLRSADLAFERGNRGTVVEHRRAA